MIKDLRKDINKLADPEKAKLLQRYFKTGKGEYAEGDIFIGLMVPQSRVIVKKYKDLPQAELKELLKSKIHEERLIALLILVNNFKKGDEKQKKQIANFYLKHLRYINNWHLVDLSAPSILGEYFADRNKDLLLKLAVSPNIWERRVAVLITFYFIKYQKSSEWAFKVAKMLLNDEHDLIHKAVGWMLRETGKNILQNEEEVFLKKYYKKMPRTMLRYALEHFKPELRKAYMSNAV